MLFEFCANDFTKYFLSPSKIPLTPWEAWPGFFGYGVKPCHESFCQSWPRAPRFSMFRTRLLSGGFIALWLFSTSAAELIISDDAPLQMPAPGAHQLRVLSPTLLELTLITTKQPDPSPVEQWNFA